MINGRKEYPIAEVNVRSGVNVFLDAHQYSTESATIRPTIIAHEIRNSVRIRRAK